MNKNLRIFLVALVVIAFVSVAFIWAQTGPTKRSGQSNVGQLYLVEKNPSTWEVVEGGAWGKMTYKVHKGKFDCVFDGHDLIPGESYTLIYYPDPWPGNGLVCFGTAIANGGGNVHIQGSVNWDFRLTTDTNHPCAKIWLVLTNHVDFTTKKMISWDPTEYLFEFNVILCDY